MERVWHEMDAPLIPYYVGWVGGKKEARMPAADTQSRSDGSYHHDDTEVL